MLCRRINEKEPTLTFFDLELPPQSTTTTSAVQAENNAHLEQSISRSELPSGRKKKLCTENYTQEQPGNLENIPNSDYQNSYAETNTYADTVCDSYPPRNRMDYSFESSSQMSEPYSNAVSTICLYTNNARGSYQTNQQKTYPFQPGGRTNDTFPNAANTTCPFQHNDQRTVSETTYPFQSTSYTTCSFRSVDNEDSSYLPYRMPYDTTEEDSARNAVDWPYTEYDDSTSRNTDERYYRNPNSTTPRNINERKCNDRVYEIANNANRKYYDDNTYRNMDYKYTEDNTYNAITSVSERADIPKNSYNAPFKCPYKENENTCYSDASYFDSYQNNRTLLSKSAKTPSIAYEHGSNCLNCRDLESTTSYKALANDMYRNERIWTIGSVIVFLFTVMMIQKL